MNLPHISQTTRWQRLAFATLVATGTIGVALTSIGQAQSTASRWLRLQRSSGEVTTLTGRRRQVGERLSAVGQGLITGRRSSAHLAVDDGIGTIAIAQNTRLTIQRLSVLPDGAKVTVIDVPQGQARLQVRRFTNPNSRLELHTPSGVAAVRGTEFGVSVDQAGQTSIATLEGQVEASSQTVVVPVNPGMVSIIYPGEPPSPARSLDRKLDIRWNGYEWRDDHFYISGWIDPANRLSFVDNEVAVSRAGWFEEKLQLSGRSQPVVLTVKNAMGEARNHRLVPWLSHDEAGQPD